MRDQHHPYRNTAQAPLPCQEPPRHGSDWGTAAVMGVLWLACVVRVAATLTRGEPFGVVPSLALVVALVVARLFWEDVAPSKRP